MLAFFKRAAAPKDGIEPSYSDAVPLLSRVATNYKNDVRLLAIATHFPYARGSDAARVCGDGAGSAWKSLNLMHQNDQHSDMGIQEVAEKRTGKVLRL